MITQLFNVVYHSILIYLSIIVLICPYCYWDAHGCAVIVVMQKNICWWSLYVEIMSLMIWSQVGFHRSGFLGELPESYWNNPAGWWCQPLWKILVSWDYNSQSMETYIMFQTTNQNIRIIQTYQRPCKMLTRDVSNMFKHQSNCSKKKGSHHWSCLRETEGTSTR